MGSCSVPGTWSRTSLVNVCLVLLGAYYAATDGVLMALASTLVQRGQLASALAILTDGSHRAGTCRGGGHVRCALELAGAEVAAGIFARRDWPSLSARRSSLLPRTRQSVNRRDAADREGLGGKSRCLRLLCCDLPDALDSRTSCGDSPGAAQWHSPRPHSCGQRATNAGAPGGTAQVADPVGSTQVAPAPRRVVALRSVGRTSRRHLPTPRGSRSSFGSRGWEICTGLSSAPICAPARPRAADGVALRSPARRRRPTGNLLDRAPRRVHHV